MSAAEYTCCALSHPYPACRAQNPRGSPLEPPALSPELEVELDWLTDHYPDEMFDLRGPEFATVQFPISRFVVDPDRFKEDAKKPMAKRGQGVIHTRTTDGRQLRNPLTAAEREALLERIHRPHHTKLKQLVEEALAARGRALIIDGHSFPNRPLPVDKDQNPSPPDICIGTDKFHAPR